MFESQYTFIKRNPDKYRKYARDYYHRSKEDPEKVARRKEKREEWYSQNKEAVLEKQKEKKRARKDWAIQYLGGRCKKCSNTFHPAVYEFHHRDLSLKDRDPSKMLSLSEKRLKDELDKCDLLCANCHRLVHNEERY